MYDFTNCRVLWPLCSSFHSVLPGGLCCDEHPGCGRILARNKFCCFILEEVHTQLYSISLGMVTLRKVAVVTIFKGRVHKILVGSRPRYTGTFAASVLVYWSQSQVCTAGIGYQWSSC